jgi:hypothetical protein
MHDVTTPNLPANTDMSSLTELATAVAKSGLFAMKTVEQAITLMALCRSEGLDPIQACRRYHIIQNRPAMRADAMQADFQARGGKIKWIARDAERCEAEFSHQSGGAVTILWTLEMAKTAQLLGNDNWRKYPRQMLHARVVSEGVRAVLPEVVCGVYTPEEVSDFSDPPASKPPSQPAVNAATSIVRASSAKTAATPPHPGEGKQSPAGAVEAEFTEAPKKATTPAAEPASSPAATSGGGDTISGELTGEYITREIPPEVLELLNEPNPEDVAKQRILMTKLGIQVANRDKALAEALKADWRNAANAGVRIQILDKAKATLRELCA